MIIGHVGIWKTKAASAGTRRHRAGAPISVETNSSGGNGVGPGEKPEPSRGYQYQEAASSLQQRCADGPSCGRVRLDKPQL